MKSAREKMNYVAAYYDVGSFRGAAGVCDTTPKTIKRAVVRHLAGQSPTERRSRPSNTDGVAELVAKRVKATRGRISAKRLLPEAVAAGYVGSARNFRRVVAKAKRAWRADNARGRRPGVWAPGETLVIDWGVEDGLHLFCAVAAWSRFRFVRFATDERAETTFRLLVECFESLGGVPKVVLADRMGCLKGGVVANVVIPTPAYVRFATHYGFRPDFCEAADPESKGFVSHCTSWCWLGGNSSAEVASLSFDRSGLAGYGRVEEPGVAVIGLVTGEQAGTVPGLDGGWMHAEDLGDLGNGELAGSMQAVAPAGQRVIAA